MQLDKIFVISLCIKLCMLGVVLLQLSCVSNVPQYDARLSDEDAVASTDVKQVFFEKLQYGEERSGFFTLNLMHEFEEGKSVYRAFELPEYKQPYQLIVRSRMFESQGKSQLFLPIIQKYDADYKATDKYEASSEAASAALSKAGLVEIDLVISANDKYIVIYADRKLMELPINSTDSKPVYFARAGLLDIVVPLRGQP